MGIDAHGLNFLRYAKGFRNFGKTITIGRQGIQVIEPLLRNAVMADSSYKNDKYCEQLLMNYFGSSIVDSIDNSSFEDASIIHDMNQPIPSNIHAQYDTVIDGGCLEHIYNVNQALKNCSLLLKPGGQILHILPANNYCGHGFWQFSPELFFSLYSNKNGYQDTEVFLADLSNINKWFKVKPPKNGQRVNVSSSTQLYVLARTVLREGDFSHNNVQQSDYVFEWSNNSTNMMVDKNLPEPNKIKQYLKQSPLYHRLKQSTLYNRYLRNLRIRSPSNSELNRLNPGLIEIDISQLLESKNRNHESASQRSHE